MVHRFVLVFLVTTSHDFVSSSNLMVRSLSIGRFVRRERDDAARDCPYTIDKQHQAVKGRLPCELTRRVSQLDAADDVAVYKQASFAYRLKATHRTAATIPWRGICSRPFTKSTSEALTCFSIRSIKPSTKGIADDVLSSSSFWNTIQSADFPASACVLRG